MLYVIENQNLIVCILLFDFFWIKFLWEITFIYLFVVDSIFASLNPPITTVGFDFF